MSYVDALFDRDRDTIHIVERIRGQREFREYPSEFTFYYADPRGKHRSIYGDPVTQVRCRSQKEFRKELKIHGQKTLFESDINPVFRCLANNYYNHDAPELQTAFFDIEADFDTTKGFSPPSDPFNKITAITVYLDWLDQLVTLAIPPKTVSAEEAQKIAAKFGNTFMFDREEDMLETFLALIEDADVLSGWNSEGYDIPYTVNRITKVLGKEYTRQFCLWNQFPKKRTFERYGAENETYDLVGRVHMDYMQLYRKYTYEERHSYSLDAIGEHELNEKKVAYEGTLDQLYNHDFEKFVDYNRQDTALLGKLDKKLKFLALANELAHANTVLLQTTMGAVAVTEQAIINEAHERGLIVPNRKDHGNNTAAAGAYVAYPKKGMHKWIGSIDLNSLYPSVIRALNMAPETILGQLRQDYTEDMVETRMAKKKSFAEAWEGEFGSREYGYVMAQDTTHPITVDWENGEVDTLTGAEIYKLIYLSSEPWMLSANGTIFRYDIQGVVPGLLERWYEERKDLQKKKKDAQTPEDREFWDKRQLVKKINLNSLYGAILNPGCRFFDKRIGQSTTLTGRQIAKHMDAYANELIVGEYNHIGDAVIYGDTDSCYFSAWPAIRKEVEAGSMTWDKDTVVHLYDQIGEQVSDSFPDFMKRAFACPRKYGEIVKCGREVVAESGLFITKKRYALLVYDDEGERKDVDDKPGKVKAMGLDLKRSDTPKFMQDFLSSILLDTLLDLGEDYVTKRIRDFKLEFKQMPSWEKGTPKRVNNLTKFRNELARKGKVNMPGHVRAALNWNSLREMNSDKHSLEIMDGQKTIVCKLKPNPMGYTSVAYPIDELHIPEWFKQLPFDDDLMTETIVDAKVNNLLGELDWDLKEKTDTSTTFDSLFEF